MNWLKNIIGKAVDTLLIPFKVMKLLWFVGRHYETHMSRHNQNVTNMLGHLEKLRKKDSEHDLVLQNQRRELNAAISTLRGLSTTHVDVSNNEHDPNVVILHGRVYGRDYVNVVSLNGGDFESLVRHMRKYHQHSKIGRIDVPFNSYQAEIIHHEMREEDLPEYRPIKLEPLDPVINPLETKKDD